MIYHICIHPQKGFIQSWINVTQLAESKPRGICVKRNRHTQYKKDRKQTNTTWIYTTRIIKYIHRWWYINRGLIPSTII